MLALGEASLSFLPVFSYIASFTATVRSSRRRVNRVCMSYIGTWPAHVVVQLTQVCSDKRAIRRTEAQDSIPEVMEARTRARVEQQTAHFCF